MIFLNRVKRTVFGVHTKKEYGYSDGYRTEWVDKKEHKRRQGYK